MENDITSFKRIKLLKTVIKDLNSVLSTIEECEKKLLEFKFFSNIREIISVMETNKTLLFISKNKYEKELAEITKEHTE